MAKSKKAPKANARKPAKHAPARKAVKAMKSSRPQAAKAVKAAKAAAKPAAKPPAKPSAAKAPAKRATPAKTNGAPVKKGKAAVHTESEAMLAHTPRHPRQSLAPFLEKQRDRLLQLRDGMLDSMMGVAKDNLRSRAEGSEASAFGMHQADAGSDAYDRDFALSLLSQEQDALYEIDEALKRIDAGSYGVCEMSGKAIPHARLEAIPFARCTVECQSQLEKQQKLTRTRVPVTSLFGLTDEEGGESEEEEAPAETKERD